MLQKYARLAAPLGYHITKPGHLHHQDTWPGVHHFETPEPAGVDRLHPAKMKPLPGPLQNGLLQANLPIAFHPGVVIPVRFMQKMAILLDPFKFIDRSLGRVICNFIAPYCPVVA